MKIDSRLLGPQCLQSSALASAFSVLIHVTSNVHFLVAAAILLVAWPVTDFVIEAIASKNPSAAERVIVRSWWPVAAKYVLVLLVAGALWYWVPLPFMTAFAYALLVLASIGAINGIVIEQEDNAPGGWLNPKGRKQPYQMTPNPSFQPTHSGLRPPWAAELNRQAPTTHQGDVVLHTLQFLATLSTCLFAGAAVYINLVEHPARMGCDTKTAATVWAPSYKKAAIMQAALAIVGFLTGLAVWLLGGGVMWLIGAVFIGAVVPFTLIVIMPTNHKLLEPGRDLSTAETRTLLERWGKLHGVRSALSGVASVVYVALLLGA